MLIKHEDVNNFFFYFNQTGFAFKSFGPEPRFPHLCKYYSWNLWDYLPVISEQIWHIIKLIILNQKGKGP